MQESLWHLLAATLIGFAVGLERERAKVERQGSTIGGVRTFTLLGLLGGVGALGPAPWLSAAGLLGVAGLEAQEALEVARRLADEERIALARLSLGAAHLVAGALEEARPHLEAATSPKPPDPAAGPEQPGGAVRFTR